MGMASSQSSTTTVVAAAVQLCTNGIIFWVNGVEAHVLPRTTGNEPIAIRIEKNGTNYTARYAFSDGTTVKTGTYISATSASFLSFGGYGGAVYSTASGYWGQSAAKNSASIDDPMQLLGGRFINYV
jgi:hypothetical protein